MTTKSRSKIGPAITGGQWRRMPDARLRPLPTTPTPAPARSLWQRVWAALWPASTPEQLYARQQRHAQVQERQAVMTVGGHLALIPSPSAARTGRRAQADLP
ncbi:hypothetical protein [Deinococcus sp.]|uniref:hypothetical protein n=1 Tax=Deinococcus sp. TaxID=47478 RepID=UPI002869A1FD|nr:hypothetical protein [Deinococcus sp.]